MAKKNPEPEPSGIAVNVPADEPRYPDGVPLNSPSVSESPDSEQSGQTKAATTTKEN